MKSNTNFRFSVLVLAVLVIWPIAEAQAASGSFEKSIAVDEPIQLDVRTGSGKITIESGASGRIEVVGYISTKRGFFSRSSKNAEEAVQLSGGINTDFMDTRAEALMRCGRSEAALEQLGRAHALSLLNDDAAAARVLSEKIKRWRALSRPRSNDE